MSFMQCPLDDLLAGVIDYRGKTPTKTDSGIRLVTAKVIKQGRVMSEGPQEYIAAKDYDEVMQRGIPQCHDILITTEAPLGELALWDSEEQIALAQRVILLRPDNEKIDPYYLFYYLQSSYFQDQLHANSTGTTVPGIKNPVLRSLLIRYPVKEQQQEIGQILSHYDDLIEINRRRIALFEESARLLYREMLTGVLVCEIKGSLPPGWKRTTLEKICDQIKDQVDPSKVNLDTPYLSMEHMTPKSVSLGVWETAGKVNSSKLQFQRKDVLFGRIRPYFHKVGVAQINGITSTDMIVVRPKVEELLPIVALTMSSDEFVAYAVTTSNGTKMPRADWKVLKQWEVIIPASSELSEFASKVLPIFQLLEVLSAQNKSLVAARDELLPKLMSGAIRV